MTELQKEKQDLTIQLYPVPKELKIIFKNRSSTKVIHALWKTWHEEKRADTRALVVKKQNIED
jgi:hypothetical protein